MAIYHLSVKTISRSAGRSATAAAAYRAAAAITDERTGEIHDFTRKRGVESATLLVPADAPGWAHDRCQLWNAAELAEKRKNSTVAREFEIALPEELSPDERQRLAHDFARELVERHACAADVAIHEPGKLGDNRNHHAHILLSTRRLGPEGFGEKTRELDDKKTGSELITQWRERFAILQNERLAQSSSDEHVDHRSLVDQQAEAAERGDLVAALELQREPQRHVGVQATQIDRKAGYAVTSRGKLRERITLAAQHARSTATRWAKELVAAMHAQAEKLVAKQVASEQLPLAAETAPTPVPRPDDPLKALMQKWRKPASAQPLPQRPAAGPQPQPTPTPRAGRGNDNERSYDP